MRTEPRASTRIDPTRPPAGLREQRLKPARALTRALDEAIRIPGTDIRLGLDALLGLVPGFGDVAGAAFSGYLILLASRHGAPASVLARMLGNVGVDTVVGAVPVLGDLFDIGWKSNSRNLALLEGHLERPGPTRAASRAFVVGAIVVLTLLAAGGLFLAVLAVRALLGVLG